MNPKVTIIVATYNRANFILETLLSIQKQSFTAWECLIINDHGVDNTQEVISSVLEEDRRFHYLKRPHNYKKGLSGCRNYGLDIAKGEYVIFFDDDDIVHPLNLEICISVLCDEDIFFCRYIYGIFKDDFVYNFDLSRVFNLFDISQKNIESIIKQEIQLNSCSVMWKRNCFNDNRFEECLMYAEDLELYTRIISHGFSGVSIDKVLYFARKHEKSNTAEFYRNDINRKSSNAKAIFLMIDNLSKKQLITNSLTRFFIKKAYSHREYKLFSRIRLKLSNSIIGNFKNIFFYHSLPIRLFLYRHLKK